jgi:SLIT-ROBO Rho GTPase activating protein
MDPYNLAICFGPTLLPIPEGKDQASSNIFGYFKATGQLKVIHQNSVNEVVKNLIVHCEDVFIQRLPGPRYEKYNFASLETPAETELELFMDDELEEQQQEEG